MSLRKNFVYSIIFTASQYIFPLLIFPYVSRVLGVANVGKVEYADSILNYFLLFSTLGVNIVGVREIAKNKNDQQKLQEVFSSLLSLTFITTTVSFIIYCIILSSITSGEDLKKLLMIGSGKLIFSFLLIEWFYKGFENFKLITLRTFFVKTLYTILIYVLVKNQNDYELYWSLTVISLIINAIINYSFSRKFVKFSFKSIQFGTYARPFYKYGIYLLLTSMYTTFNVFFLGYKTNEVQVGYYSTAVKIYMVFLGIYTAFSTIMFPRMSALISNNDKDKVKQFLQFSFDLLFKLSLPIICFIMFFAKDIIFFIAGNGFEGSVKPLQIILPLIFIVGLAQIFSVQILMPRNKDNNILGASIFGSIVGLSLNLLLVSSYQSIGSSVSFITSESAVMLVLFWSAKKHSDFTFNWKSIFINLLICIPIIIISYLLKFIFNDFKYLFILASVIVAIYYLGINILIKDKVAMIALQNFKIFKK